MVKKYIAKYGDDPDWYGWAEVEFDTESEMDAFIRGLATADKYSYESLVWETEVRDE